MTNVNKKIDCPGSHVVEIFVLLYCLIQRNRYLRFFKYEINLKYEMNFKDLEDFFLKIGKHKFSLFIFISVSLNDSIH